MIFILKYATTAIIFVVANKMTTGANAILLQYTASIYVALALRMQKDASPLSQFLH
ncbi:hypothetical protein [Alkaliphilus sp. B6464]|uniref:hypothetical protein n=1 Tax=Alkaliphilus sp. B6464 TaxID=2731219 RepID=UPI001BA98F3B|nr:hypothetical protein [Alkaliphilus sp. B6464]